MTIALVQVGGTPTDSATSGSRAFASNVAKDSLLVIAVTTFKDSSDAFVVGDISNSGGATLGAFSLDIQKNYQYDVGNDNWLNTAIFSCLVTVAGACTITVGGAPAGTFWNVACGEFSGNWDAARLETSNSAQAATGAPDSGNATSAGAALFAGGLTTNTSGATTHTQDGAFSLIDEEEDGATHITGAGIYRITVGGTTDSASWTAPSTTNWAAVVAVYKEAGVNNAIAWVTA